MFLHHRQNNTVSAAINHRIPSPVLPEVPSPVLPEELIREILLRLPVKSLLQLKCACKLWKTLISDSHFAKTNLQIRMNNPRLVFSDLETPYKIESYSLDSLFENSSSTPVEPITMSYVKKNKNCIIGSCNGLLCMYHSYKNVVRLGNPSIGFKSNKSPEAFSPDWMVVQYGFGYDQVNDKYKVLVVAQNKYDSSQLLTKIYIFGENFWKTIPNFSFRPTGRLGKFASGTLNWVVYKIGVSSDQNQNVIFSFDLEKETSREILLPETNVDNWSFTQRMLYVLSDCLCVCKCDRFGAVWLMKEYGVVDSWTKLMSIPQKHIHNEFSPIEPLFISKRSVLFLKTMYSKVSICDSNDSRSQTSFAEPLFFFKNGSLALGEKPSSQLFIYSSNSGRVESLITSTLGSNLHIYHESLVSPQW
ncbi:F-box/kelch-repeat protein At3g23880-like [Vicia villosa]|uniref:F-box/kelch-repeat protein At3g23880-like n=1 Tax=Vicia villosa TaxID=3911 RepID=UPI00273B2E5C|nr:F-box/kelch-repeat protein At3g23880-like [Vicia villosa]